MPAQLAYVHPPIARHAIQTAPQVEGRERVYRGSFADVRALLPDFERVAFTLGPDAIANRTLETIVRCADLRQGLPSVPVGVVSRHDAMVTHCEVLDAVREGVANAGIDPTEAELEAVISDYGRRMALTVMLPVGSDLDPEDGHARALRLFCVNSVDRSTRLRIAVGCYEVACGNGPMAGKTRMEIRGRYREDISLEAIGKVLAGLACAGTESNELREWEGFDR